MMHSILSCSLIWATLFTGSLTTAQEVPGSSESCTTFNQISNYTQWGYSSRVSAGIYCDHPTEESDGSSACDLYSTGYVEQPTLWNISDAINNNITALALAITPLIEVIELSVAKTSNGSFKYFGNSVAGFGEDDLGVQANQSVFAYWTTLLQCFVGSVSGCNASFILADDTVLAVCTPMRIVWTNGTVLNDFAGLFQWHLVGDGPASAAGVANLTTNPALVLKNQSTTLGSPLSYLTNNLNISGLYGNGGWDNGTDHPDGRVPKYGAQEAGNGSTDGNSTSGSNGTSGENGTSSANGTNSTGSGHKSAAAKGAGFTMVTTVLVLGAMAALAL